MGAAALTLLRAAPGPAVACHPALRGKGLRLSQRMYTHCCWWRCTQALRLAAGSHCTPVLCKVYDLDSCILHARKPGEGLGCARTSFRWPCSLMICEVFLCCRNRGLRDRKPVLCLDQRALLRRQLREVCRESAARIRKPLAAALHVRFSSSCTSL